SASRRATTRPCSTRRGRRRGASRSRRRIITTPFCTCSARRTRTRSRASSTQASRTAPSRCAPSASEVGVRPLLNLLIRIARLESVMKILVFAGSLRKGSFNKLFAREAMRLLSSRGVETEFVDLQPLAIPVYDGDLEEASGVPAGVRTLSDKILAADALLISTPEYNGSIPGILKNTVDWLSRLKPVCLTGKHLLLIAASPGALGGIRSLWHSRQPFEVLGTHVFPE